MLAFKIGSRVEFPRKHGVAIWAVSNLPAVKSAPALVAVTYTLSKVKLTALTVQAVTFYRVYSQRPSYCHSHSNHLS